MLTLMAAAAIAVAGVLGQAPSRFAAAPMGVFPLLDRNARLDMIDYFNSGMTNSTANRLEGRSRITAMDDASVTVEMSGSSTVQLCLLPAGADTLTMVITTVQTPAPDSRIELYDSKWQKLDGAKVFTAPAVADWLATADRDKAAEVEMLLPFMLVSYRYDPATATLTLTNNTSQFVGRDIYEPLATLLKGDMQYRWNGKKFQR